MQCLSPVESEVLNVVRAAGIEPDRIDDTQLLQAINTLISGGGNGSGGDAPVIAGSEIGSVSAFAMPTPPEGWLVCDGSEVSRTDYADLFAAVGVTFGAGDGSTTFVLPDLRGEFIRGWDNGREADSGREFGSWQADEFKSHDHPYVGRDGYATGNFALTTRNSAGANTSSSGGGHIGYRGGDETRPRNIAMTFAIKAFYPSAATGQ